MDVLKTLKIKKDKYKDDKMDDYIKILKVNKLIPSRIDDEKLGEKYKTMWTKIEDLQNVELNALPVYHFKCKKTKISLFLGLINESCKCYTTIELI